MTSTGLPDEDQLHRNALDHARGVFPSLTYKVHQPTTNLYEMSSMFTDPVVVTCYYGHQLYIFILAADSENAFLKTI